ncbi:MAG: CPBP family glutamic-type intramembrane protease, partial [Deltaproteobacteria bacterium]|nr:CPBP family glutamic-type intramembrane protease [Deltaproteobacteria bacterium]
RDGLTGRAVLRLQAHAALWPLLLGLYLPCAKLAGFFLAREYGMPLAGALLFYGGGVLISLGTLGSPPWRAPLARVLGRPWLGIAQGVLVFCLLILLGEAVLLVPGVSPALASLLAPLTWRAGGLAPLVGGGGGGLLHTAGVAAASIAEEWLFRVVLFWGVLKALSPRPADPVSRRSAGALLVAMSLYFALLHLPGGAPEISAAFLGSLTLGALLFAVPRFSLVATLHVLYNLNLP